MSARALFSPGSGNARSCRAAVLAAVVGLFSFAPGARAGWGAPGIAGAPASGPGVGGSPGVAQGGRATVGVAPSVGRGAGGVGAGTGSRVTPGAAYPGFTNPGARGVAGPAAPGVFPRTTGPAAFPGTSAPGRPASGATLPARVSPVQGAFVPTNRTPLSRPARVQPNPVGTGGSPNVAAGRRLPASFRPARDSGRWPAGRGGGFAGRRSPGFHPGAGYLPSGGYFPSGGYDYGGALSSGSFNCPSAYANFSSGFCAPGYVSYALPVFYGAAYPVPVVSSGEGVAGGTVAGEEEAPPDPEAEAERPRSPEPAARRPSSTLGDGAENPESVRPALRGPDAVVEAVQEELARRGYFAGKANGVLGASSQEALRRFQSDHRLAPTGRINEATLFALGLN